jgi:hypothetical protein
MSVSEPPSSDDDPLRRAFTPVIGLPAWNVRKGHGSFLTLELGPPHLVVREPIVTSPGADEAVRAALRRRRVHPRGAWHLWIYCCQWRALANGTEVAWSEASDDQIDAAAAELDGQVLTAVTADPLLGTSAFSFDLGGSLHTWPHSGARKDEQWMLYMESGEVFAYRGDGCYSLEPGSAPVGEEVWHPLASNN